MNGADLVLRGGRVYTGEPSRPWVSAVAVARGRILAVGDDALVEDVRVRGTEVVELDGMLVLPAFQDSHIHPIHGGLDRMRCDLHDVRSPQDYLRAIESYAASHAEAPWILGGGWALDAFDRGLPHRALLDAVVPDRPAYLTNRDGHGAWVNSRALELAGIVGETPDPPDGRIERDPDGEPSGVVHEGAMDLVEALIPPTTRAELEDALRHAQDYLFSLGVAAWQDAIVDAEALSAYLSLRDRGELRAKVVAALWWERDRGEDQIEDLVEMREVARRGQLRATSVKIMQDGIPENFTAALLEPYLDPDGRGPRGSGLSFVEPSVLARAVTRLDAEGFQVHVHAIGDRAVREALDAFEAARRANGPNDLRHHIAHLQLVHPDDVPRFARLGVVANAQPYWASFEKQMRELCVPFFGPERTRTQYPFASLLRTGARLAFGSDWPVTTANPLEEMQVAVTRLPFEEPDVTDVFLPEERLTVEQAIHAFTMGTAYVNHLDHETASIVPGRLADLVALERNIFEIPHDKIGTTGVAMTVIEGNIVTDRRDRSPGDAGRLRGESL